MAGEDALAFFFGAVVGDAADGGFGEFLDFFFGLGGAIPVAEEEAAFFDFDEEFIPSVHAAGVGFAIVAAAVEEVELNLVHQLCHMVGDAAVWHTCLLPGIAVAHLAVAGREGARADG